jgi:predicted O-linked N-acetylglucosamine transferase (SPINDLY family)
VGAVQHIQAGRFEQARQALARVLQQSPNDVEATTWMCYVLMEIGPASQALFYAMRANALQPNSVPLLNNLGKSLLMTGDIPDAILAYAKAHRIDPDHLSTMIGLSIALNAEFRFDEAEKLCLEGLAKNPGQPRLQAQLSVALLQTGRPREAVAALKQAAAGSPDDAVMASGLAQTMNYAGNAEPRDILGAHKSYGRLLGRMHPGTHSLPPTDPDPNRKLRVGVLSADLRSHAVGYFAEPILEHLDRSAFEVTCYSMSAAEDATSARLKDYVRQWRNPVSTTDPELVAMIRKDQIDVLVELSGHTPGHRLPALYLRAAPVQATYFGYPNTTGVPGAITESWTATPTRSRQSSMRWRRRSSSAWTRASCAIARWRPRPKSPPRRRSRRAASLSAPSTTSRSWMTWRSGCTRGCSRPCRSRG